MQKLVVVGGNGFIGSAVCKLALSRGMQVTSISSSGVPYRTPKGHTPDWTSNVNWQKADALDPTTYTHLLAGATAIVHSLGTLLEDSRYKEALRKGGVSQVVGAFVGSSSRNPLQQGLGADAGRTGYNALNRDSALRMCEAFMTVPASPEMTAPRAFVYISAEDVFRPIIPARYIESKREAEAGIQSMMQGQTSFRSVYIRPTLVYHPHHRPLTTPLAALFDLSASLHAAAPPGVPTPSAILRLLGARSPSDAVSVGSPLDSIANALTLPPIHVDHVAEAACVAADMAQTDVRGVVGVRAMRELIGWKEKGKSQGNLEGLGAFR